ncbi:DUF1552 domain-containing protein [Gemmata sp.]|uniref:DUF1552 domain-containing protein n=1 Tax=Gemmata sp. TaxID=1914242 RepID=UPI003F714AD7
MTTELTRRALLRDAALGAGATVLGPALARVAAHAAGDAAAASPTRVVFVTQSNGFHPAHMCPAGWKLEPNGSPPANTDLVEVALKDRDLHAALDPFAAFKDKVTLIRGLSGKVGSGSADHSGGFAALGCYNGKNGPAGQTIDSALGDALPAPFRHVAVGLGGKPETVMNHLLSVSAPGKVQPIVCSPDLAYKSLFGSVAGGAARAAFDRKTHLLDFLADDVKRSRAALAAGEREKFDQYVQALETLHARQTELLAREDAIKRAAPKLGDKQAADKSSLILEAQFEIAAAALAAGLTRSVTLASGGGSQAMFGTFPEFGIRDLHAIGHGGAQDGKTYEECFVELRRFHCKLIAGLVKSLSAVKEGSGTAMDNTVIVYLSDSAESHHARFEDWPVVVIGTLGGKLKPGGRFLQYPGYKRSQKHKTLASLYTTLLHAAGKPRDTFGAPDLTLKDLDQTGPLSELLA